MSLFDCKIARTKVEIISLLGSRRGFIQFPVRIKVVEGGIGFADPLRWGLRPNQCPFASLTSIFVFLIRCERSSRVCFKQKCPAKSRGIGLVLRRGRDSNPRYGCPHNGFRDRHNRPLCHLSEGIDDECCRSGCKNKGFGAIFCNYEGFGGKPIVLRIQSVWKCQQVLF